MVARLWSGVLKQTGALLEELVACPGSIGANVDQHQNEGIHQRRKNFRVIAKEKSRKLLKCVC